MAQPIQELVKLEQIMTEMSTNLLEEIKKYVDSPGQCEDYTLELEIPRNRTCELSTLTVEYREKEYPRISKYRMEIESLEVELSVNHQKKIASFKVYAYTADNESIDYYRDEIKDLKDYKITIYCGFRSGEIAEKIINKILEFAQVNIIKTRLSTIARLDINQLKKLDKISIIDYGCAFGEFSNTFKKLSKEEEFPKVEINYSTNLGDEVVIHMMLMLAKYGFEVKLRHSSYLYIKLFNEDGLTMLFHSECRIKGQTWFIKLVEKLIEKVDNTEYELISRDNRVGIQNKQQPKCEITEVYTLDKLRRLTYIVNYSKFSYRVNLEMKDKPKFKSARSVIR